MDSTQKSAGSFIKASGNPQALLQFRKKVLNHVSPEILFSVKLLGLLLIRLWKNHCLHLLLIQAIQQPCFDSVGNVFEQGLDLIQNSAQQHVSALQIKSLTRAFIKTYWIAKLITGCMNFGCKSSLMRTNNLWYDYFFCVSCVDDPEKSCCRSGHTRCLPWPLALQ